MNKKHLIYENDPILTAFKKIKKIHNKILIVLNKKKNVVGIITLGDLYKSYLEKNINITKVSKIMNTKFLYLKNEKDFLKFYFKKYSPQILHIPIIKNGKLIKILFYKNILKLINKNNNSKLNYSTLIMAGGFGSRMGSFLKESPKPLVKDKNNKPLIVNLIKKLIKYRFYKIYVSLFYKRDEIEKKLRSEFKNKIFFIKEKKRTGTIGSLSKLPYENRKNLFVINCDTLINFNPKLAINFHVKSNNDITIIVSTNEVTLNYGLVNLNKTTQVTSIIEKPVHEILVNTGMYVFSEKVFKLIPKNKFFDADKLINLCISKQYKIRAFPIREEMWADIGTKNKYLNYIYSK